MFRIIFLSVWALLHAYVLWRVATIPPITHRVSRWALAGAACALWGSFPLARILYGWGWNALALPVEWMGSTWLGVLFLLFSMLLFADAATLILSAAGWVTRRLGYARAHGLLTGRGPTLRLGALAVAGVLSLVALAQGFRLPIVRDYEVRLANLPRELDGLVVVELSDLHLGSLIGAGWARGVVRRVNALEPDLILLAGDLVEGHGEDRAERFLPALRELRAPLGVWAVTGNHDHYSGIEGSMRFLGEAGIEVLMERWAEVTPGLVVAGTDGRHSRGVGAEGDVESVAKSLAGCPANVATILLAHSPRPAIADAASSAGVGLMLSGHTHAGQIWPFSYIARMANPLFAGRYDVGGMTVIVCRGTGTWGPRMRLWRANEIVRIRLVSAE